MTLRLLSVATLVALIAATPAARAQTSIRFGLRLGGNLATRSGTDPTYSPREDFFGGNSTRTTIAQKDYTRKAIIAPQFGAVLDVRFGKLALQPAVLFSQKGVDQTLDVTTTTKFLFGSNPFEERTQNEKLQSSSRANYLEIPINLVYTAGGDHGFQIFAGPYVAFGMGGRAEIEEQGTNPDTSPSIYNDNYYSYFNTFFLFRDTYPGAPLNNFSAAVSPASYQANSGAAVARRFDAGVNAGIGYRFSALQVQLGYGLGLVNQQPGKAPTFSTEPTAYRQRVTQLTATYFFSAPKAAAPSAL
jgi:hypothetical protein